MSHKLILSKVQPKRISLFFEEIQKHKQHQYQLLSQHRHQQLGQQQDEQQGEQPQRDAQQLQGELLPLEERQRNGNMFHGLDISLDRLLDRQHLPERHHADLNGNFEAFF